MITLYNLLGYCDFMKDSSNRGTSPYLELEGDYTGVGKIKYPEEHNCQQNILFYIFLLPSFLILESYFCGGKQHHKNMANQPFYFNFYD